jgi:hypothetical protein
LLCIPLEVSRTDAELDDQRKSFAVSYFSRPLRLTFSRYEDADQGERAAAKSHHGCPYWHEIFDYLPSAWPTWWTKEFEHVISPCHRMLAL